MIYAIKKFIKELTNSQIVVGVVFMVLIISLVLLAINPNLGIPQEQIIKSEKIRQVRTFTDNIVKDIPGKLLRVKSTSRGYNEYELNDYGKSLMKSSVFNSITLGFYLPEFQEYTEALDFADKTLKVTIATKLADELCKFRVNRNELYAEYIKVIDDNDKKIDQLLEGIQDHYLGIASQYCNLKEVYDNWKWKNHWNR